MCQPACANLHVCCNKKLPQGDYYEAVAKAIDPVRKELVACFPKDAGEQLSYGAAWRPHAAAWRCMAPAWQLHGGCMAPTAPMRAARTPCTAIARHAFPMPPHARRRRPLEIQNPPPPGLDEACFKISYDTLVIGIGSINNTFGIKGVQEYCNFFKSIEDAKALRRRVSECFERAALPAVRGAGAALVAAVPVSLPTAAAAAFACVFDTCLPLPCWRALSLKFQTTKPPY